MLIFLYGPDSYRRGKEARKIVSEYQKSHKDLVRLFDFGECRNEDEARGKLTELQEFVKSNSLFYAEKFAEIRGIFEWEIKGLRDFLKSAAKLKDLNILLSEEESGGPEYAFLRNKSVDRRDFKKLSGEPLKSFIRSEAQNLGLGLSSLAVSALSQIFSGDAWAIRTELEKLTLAKNAQEGKIIDAKDLDLAVSQSPDFFAFINGVQRSSGISYNVRALEFIMLGREDPTKIFNILASGKYMPGNLVNRLADYDIMVKSGRLSYEEVLLDLALS